MSEHIVPQGCFQPHTTVLEMTWPVHVFSSIAVDLVSSAGRMNVKTNVDEMWIKIALGIGVDDYKAASTQLYSG